MHLTMFVSQLGWIEKGYLIYIGSFYKTNGKGKREEREKKKGP